MSDHDLDRRIQILENKMRSFMQPCIQTQASTGSITAIVQLSVPSLGDKITSDVPIHGSYGFWHNPMPGCQHTMLNLNGMDGNGRSIATHDERYRPLGLVAGDTCQGDANGQLVWLSGGTALNMLANATANLTAPTVNINASTAANLTTATFTINGNVQINGWVNSTGNMTAGSIDLETHKHTGVGTGSGTSGGPAG